MKKFLVSLAVVCMISLLAVSAFAYQCEFEDQWISSVACDVESKTITVTVTDDFAAHSANGYRITVFSVNPQLALDEPSFWSVYSGAEGQAPANGKPDLTAEVLIGGNNACTGTTAQFTSEKFEEGKTYYVTIMGCANAAAGQWDATTAAFDFVFAAPNQDGEQDTADLSVIAYAVAAITGCGALVIAKKR
ncbi:MAG: hypothetical protein PUC05_03585 [Firmicutes bacterium]|nr:hypothetical protein [Bacillota bacterium]